MYLWEGAKHPLTLSQMAQVPEATLADLFANPADISSATERCRQIHHRMLPRIAATLSELAGVDLPASFWRTAFGYWLYRHICVTYEKYAYLSRMDLDRTSLKLLDKESFYIPHSHMDYLYCFCTDFGVQQLVSQYYELFANRKFPVVQLKFELPSRPATLAGFGKDCLCKAWRAFNDYSVAARKVVSGVDPTVVLCGVFNTKSVGAELFSRSGGKVAPIAPPPVPMARSIDAVGRKKLLQIPFDDDFERFLVQTLYFCLPQMFLEEFRGVYRRFLADVKSRKFTHIVSESWISDMLCSIYVAVAQQQGKTFIAHEHGSGTVFDKTLTYWIDIDASDRYLTVGWKSDHEKVVPGGFMCRDIVPYRFHPSKEKVLYIARTNLPYMMEFNIYNVPNAKMVNSLKRVRDFFARVPGHLSGHLWLRPRREPRFWDTECSLEVQEKGIKVDTGVFSDSLGSARMVVIDHLSTGAAEVLLRGIPCLIIQDEEPIEPVAPGLNDIYVQLRGCGILHHSAASAVAQLIAVYGGVQQWWTSEPVQSAVSNLVSTTLARPSATVEHLLSCARK